MLNEKETTRLSKFLSKILRHTPETIDLQLDANGWADVNELLQKIQRQEKKFTLEILQFIVETNAKKRFAFNEEGTSIRANQGHSIEIDLGLQAQQPPDLLYHGTTAKNLALILENGLQRMKRHHVHLSADTETAMRVGGRHGKAVVLTIDAKRMAADSYVFYCSENGVWLTDAVPAKYIQIAIEKPEVL